MNIKVNIFGMEMSHRIHFWYQILLKLMLFLRKLQKKITFLVKHFCDKLKRDFQLKILKLLENQVCLFVKSLLMDLTGGNWQKWKRVFLTCPCHEIYRDEAVGLKSCKNTWKITMFVKMWNLGQYRENLIFCQ